MKKMLRLTPVLLGLIVFPFSSRGQDPLESYIREGLANNLVLQQKNIGLDKALTSLQSAKSLFLPSVNLNGTFSTAEGGRYTELPVGDMLNPVYSTLNQFMGANVFPTISNEQIDFLPKNYYDAYVRTSMPLLNTDIIYNKKIEEQKVRLQEYEIRIYQRELVKNIKVAYYQYLTASEAVEVYANAQALVEKNVALNRSLLENGKGLNASLLRAQSELENVKAQLNDARNQSRNAQGYFNFLLNKPQDSPIEKNLVSTPEEVLDAAGWLKADTLGREELKMIRQAQNIQQTVLTMNRRYWVPKVNAFLDLGSQAVDWEFSSKSRYYMVGVNVGIPIFNGLRNTYKTRQAGFDLKTSELNYSYVRQQLDLSVRVAQNNLATAVQNYTASLERQKSAESYFGLIERGFQEGVNSQIEFIDATSQLTSARLQVRITTYRVLIASAELEREMAAYEIPGTSSPEK